MCGSAFPHSFHSPQLFVLVFYELLYLSYPSVSPSLFLGSARLCTSWYPSWCTKVLEANALSLNLLVTECLDSFSNDVRKGSKCSPFLLSFFLEYWFHSMSGIISFGDCWIDFEITVEFLQHGLKTQTTRSSGDDIYANFMLFNWAIKE